MRYVLPLLVVLTPSPPPLYDAGRSRASSTSTPHLDAMYRRPATGVPSSTAWRWSRTRAVRLYLRSSCMDSRQALVRDSITSTTRSWPFACQGLPWVLMIWIAIWSPGSPRRRLNDLGRAQARRIFVDLGSTTDAPLVDVHRRSLPCAMWCGPAGCSEGIQR